MTIKKSKFLIKIFIYKSFLVLVLFLPFFCRAENEKIGLSLDQSIFSFDILPGQQQEFVLNIKNIIDQEQRVSLVIQDFSLEDNNRMSFLPDKNEMFGMKDWIKFEENVWLLKSGEEKRIKFTIETPIDASIGSHYSAVSFKVLPLVDGENFQKTIVGGQIGAYIFLNILGDISGRGRIENFEAPRLVGDKKANFKAIFKNEGNIHYIPHGGIEIKNILSGKNTDEKLEKHFVFPGKTFSYEYSWLAPSLFGIYTAKAYFIDQEGRNLSAGKLIVGKYFLIIFIVAIILTIVALIFFIKRKKRKEHSDMLTKNNKLKIEDGLKILILLPFLCFWGKAVLAGEEINLEVISKPNRIEISWPKEILNEMETAIVIKKENGCPADIYDGQEIYRGNGQNFIDKEVGKNKKYCYGLIVSDVLGNTSGLLAIKYIEKEGMMIYYLKILETNYILIIGPIIVVILWLVDRFTRYQDVKRIKRIERSRILREV